MFGNFNVGLNASNNFPIQFNFNTSFFDQQSFSLLDPIFKFNIYEKIPRTFIVTTRNKSYYFNKDMLCSTSRVISSFHADNPDKLQYHLDISDETNVLQKIEQIYQGSCVSFNEKDIFLYNTIKSLLRLESSYFEEKSYHPLTNSLNVKLSKSYLNVEYILDNLLPQTFTIKTKKNEYKCSPIIARISKVIDQFLTENPESDVYNYDFDDNFGEFQIILDFLKCKDLPISMQNIDSIKEMADDLQIQSLSELLEGIIKEYDDFISLLDAQQDTVDQINEIFDLLYDIKKKTVTVVKNSILRSFWSKTKENVQELASFIMQMIGSNISLHEYLADLLIQLDKESNESNRLDILIPFIQKNLIKQFGKNFQNCSMIYILYKKGIISKDKLNKLLKEKTFNTSNNNSVFSFYSNQSSSINKRKGINVDINVLQWFLPEIIELNKIKKVELLCFQPNKEENPSEAEIFVKSYFDKIEKYKQMRDSGQPDNELTVALRHDDVDKLQSIISTINSIFEEQKVPYNIFEDFVPNGETKYLNYAAAYGAIKCFKYILLNHDKIDQKTFACAVYGGNVEIINIVKQKQKELNDDTIENDDERSDSLGTLDTIFLPVIRHQNDLFDWILEDYTVKKKINYKLVDDLFQLSVENGNAHSINVLFGKNFEFIAKAFSRKSRLPFIIISSDYGFYRLAKFLLCLFKSDIDSSPFSLGLPMCDSFFYNQRPIFGYENLSIVKLFIKYMNQYDFQSIVTCAIYNNNLHVIEYCFDHLLKNKVFEITLIEFDKWLYQSACKESSYLFDYLLKQVKLINPALRKA